MDTQKTPMRPFMDWNMIKWAQILFNGHTDRVEIISTDTVARI